MTGKQSRLHIFFNFSFINNQLQLIMKEKVLKENYGFLIDSFTGDPLPLETQALTVDDRERELSFHLLMEFSFPRLMTACVSRRGSACEECISCLKRRFQSNHWQVYFLFYYAND